MIAILGGDGAGKSTAVEALYAWLSKNFETTRFHMGKPTWSWTTRAIRAGLKIGQLLGLYPVETTYAQTLGQTSLVSPGYPWLLREVCRAHDRYQTYVKARRIAAQGRLVIFDRFPHPAIQLMDGPLAERFIRELTEGPRAGQFLSPRRANPIAQALVKLERRFYQRYAPLELLIVLRVDPQIAVQRKSGEDPVSVRARATEIWELNWEHTNALVLDGSQSKAEILAQLKALVWSAL
jgi:hypothetical protein